MRITVFALVVCSVSHIAVALAQQLFAAKKEREGCQVWADPVSGDGAAVHFHL